VSAGLLTDYLQWQTNCRVDRHGRDRRDRDG